MKERKAGIASLLAIVGFCLVCRYPLFDLHGMKEFPVTLCIVGAFLIVITGLIEKKTILPISIALGYIIGFFVGILFGYDYGEGLNNMWIIWMWCVIAAGILGIMCDLIGKQTRHHS